MSPNVNLKQKKTQRESPTNNNKNNNRVKTPTATASSTCCVFYLFRGGIDQRVQISIHHGLGRKMFVQPPPSSGFAVDVFKLFQFGQQAEFFLSTFLFRSFCFSTVQQFILVRGIDPCFECFQPLHPWKHPNDFRRVHNANAMNPRGVVRPQQQRQTNVI